MEISGRSFGGHSAPGRSTTTSRQPVARIPKKSGTTGTKHFGGMMKPSSQAIRKPVAMNSRSRTTRDEEKRRESKHEQEEEEDSLGVGASSRSTQPKAVKVRRAKVWDEAVEENHRLQVAGWRDIYEYRATYGEPERWEENDYIKCLRVKKNGYYSYWRNYRECEDKFLNHVKMFEYE